MNTKIDMSQVDMFSVGHECIETLPCQHQCTVRLKDGNLRKVTMGAGEIKRFLDNLPKPNIDRRSISMSEHCSVSQQHPDYSSDIDMYSEPHELDR